MCGICGFNYRDAELLARMSSSLAHRGPDDEGTFADDHVSLGHRRLSIIDVSARGRQPMTSEDGSLVLIYNGEVYNFREIRAELSKEGYRFRSETDSEVVLAAFHRWGKESLSRLNGMFAFAIYDRVRAKLFLARDRLGVKPLYYSWDGAKLLFASELKALLGNGVRPRLHIPALAQFFTYRFNYGSQTVLENVHKLPPGHFLSFDLGSGRVEELSPWWKLPLGDDRKENLTELARELRRLLEDSVERRLVADVPLGFFLSGGLDSSIVTGIAARTGARLKTFSAGFDTTNELPFARVAARHFGSEHHEVRIGDEALELLDDMVYHMDEPVGDAAFLATLILSREARKEVKVVLAGEGADELFAGYERYKFTVYGSALSLLVPGFLKSSLARAPFPTENGRRLLRVLAEETREGRYLEVIRLFSKDELEELAVAASGTNGAWGAALPDVDLLKAIQFFDVHTVLPNDFFLKADKMSSAFGLEERVPFLDYRVVELAFQMPSSAKLRRCDEKHVLKRAFEDLLPREILRRRKHGFDVPMDHWLRGALGQRLKKLLSEDAHDLYRKEPVLDLLERFRSSRGSYRGSFYAAQKLWSVLVFELWYRRFVG
jgi:asparagine synthase (glutamine-hydrolysing)